MCSLIVAKDSLLHTRKGRLTVEADPHFTLSRLSRAEAARFHEVHPQLAGIWDKHAPGGFFGKWLLRQKTDHSVTRWGRNQAKTGAVYLAQEFGQPVGFSGWWLDPTCWPETVKFRWLGIIRSARARGLAQRLVSETIALIREDCPNALYVSESCPVWFGSMIRFWQKMGFEKWDDTDKRGIGIPFVRTVSLRKRIS